MKKVVAFKKIGLGAAFALAVPVTAFAQGQEEQEVPGEQQEQQQEEQQEQPAQQQEQEQQEQPAQQQQGLEQQGQAGQQQGASAGDVAIQGVLRGVVTSVNYAKGTVTMTTGQGTVTFRAKPTQIGALRQGEQFVAQYANYGDAMWLTENLGGAGQRDFGREARMTGNIVKLDKTSGILVLSTAAGKNVTFQAHPAEIEQLLPGQFVDVNYQQIGGQQWLMAVNSAEEQQSGQQ